MRVRSRTLTKTLDSRFGRAWKREWVHTNPPATIYSEQNVLTTGQNAFTHNVRTESMSDVNSSDVSLKISNLRRSRSSFAKSIASGAIPSSMVTKFKEFLPVNEVSHSKTDVRFTSDQPVLMSGYTNGQQSNLVTNTFTKNFRSSDALFRYVTGSTNPISWLNSNKGFLSTGGGFGLHDWYHLSDKFSEAIDSFMPNNMLLGETLIENAIFRDAFKILVNPTNALKTFVKAFSRLNSKQSRMNLGQVASFSKGSANAWLSYNFGVKPAINDVKAILNAHSNVSTRMNYLSSNRGSYVPIRVQHSIDSPVSNVLPTPVGGSSSYMYVHRVHKNSKAHLGCWGRVRDDLSYNDSWKAYVQYFGIGKVLQLGWELIPFSFVVDWVTNAQESVNTISRKFLPSFSPFAEIKALSASVREEEKFTINFFADTDPGGDGGYISPRRFRSLHIADATISSYNRFSRIPTTSGVVDLSTLGSFHAIASGALVIQRALR